MKKNKYVLVVAIYMAAGFLALNARAETGSDPYEGSDVAPASSTQGTPELNVGQHTPKGQPIATQGDEVQPPPVHEEQAPPAVQPRPPQRNPQPTQRPPQRRAQDSYRAPRQPMERTEVTARGDRNAKLWCVQGGLSIGLGISYSECTDQNTGKRYRITMPQLGLGFNLGGRYVYVKVRGGSIEGTYSGVGGQIADGLGVEAGYFRKGKNTVYLGGGNIGLSINGAWELHIESAESESRQRRGYRAEQRQDDWRKNIFNNY